MGKFSTCLFGGKPQMVNPNDKIVKISILLIKETVIGYPFSGNAFQPVYPDSKLEETVKFKIGTYNTYENGKIYPNYEHGFLELTCNTIEEAEKAYNFLVKNKGKIRNEETLKETVLSTQ